MLSYDTLVARCKKDELGWCANIKQRNQATEVVIDACLSLMPTVAQKLNEAHGVKYTQRYWHILLGAWLYHFCCIVYDRQRLLAYRTGEDISTIRNRTVPRDTYESIQLSVNDEFNKQLLADISLGYVVVDDRSFPKKTTDNDWKFDFGYIKALVFNYTLSALTTKKSVTVSVTAMRLRFQLKVFRYFSRIRPTKPLSDKSEVFTSNINVPLRSQLRAEPVKEKFLNLVNSLLPFYLPVCFVESYEKLSRLGKRYRSTPAAILSTTEIYYRYESYKHWIAICSESGTKILNLQHGGTYGLSWRSGDTFIERAPSDKFYSWGWKHPTYSLDDDRIVPMPVLPHFFGYTRQSEQLSSASRILFASNTMRTTLREFGGLPDDPYNRDKYLADQLSFYAQLPEELKKSVYIRQGEATENNRTKQYKEFWRNEHPSVLFDDRSVDFQTSLRNSKLFIVDHLSTTWLESLIIGVPTIIFLDMNDYDFTEEFKEILSMLHSVSIFHHSIETAAKEVRSMNSDVNVWWRDEHRSATLKHVLRKIAKDSDSLVFDWSKELKKISENPSLNS